MAAILVAVATCASGQDPLLKGLSRSFIAEEGQTADPFRFRNAALQKALDEFRAKGPALNLQLEPVAISWGEYQSPPGQGSVSLQLQLPRSSGLKAGQNVTFFGTILDEDGKAVRSFEETVPVSESRGDLYVDRALALPPGIGHAYLGVFSENRPLILTETGLKIAGSMNSEAPSVSALILSNNVYPLPAGQKDGGPFVFGGIKVVPKSDGMFASSDELWYFVELRHPGLDPVRNAPRMQVRLDLAGQEKEGRPFHRSALPREVSAQPLDATGSRFGLGSSMPLAGIPAGDYVLKVRLNDTVRKATYSLQQNIKIVGEEK